MMPTMEESYRLLLEKLIRFRAETASYRESYIAAAADERLHLGNRRASWHKAKALGSQLAGLDFILGRNKRQAVELGLDIPAFERAKLGPWPVVLGSQPATLGSAPEAAAR